VNFLELKPDGTLNAEQKSRILDAVRAAARQAQLVIVYDQLRYDKNKDEPQNDSCQKIPGVKR
jgi:poly-gamma-glutamate capsule biosynthesis protein CapA/YwtB (metallophosphatase superfamily)